MKKVLVLALCFFMLYGICGISAAVAAPEIQNVEFLEESGTVTVKTTLNLSSAYNVVMIAAVYSEENNLIQIDMCKEVLPEGIQTVFSKPLTVNTAEILKVFLWDEHNAPLSSGVYEFTRDDFAVSAVVYGNEYTGSINPVRKTVTFDVPKSISGENGGGINLASRRVSTTVGNYHFPGKYTINAEGAELLFNGAKVTADTLFDMTQDSVVTVTKSDGTSENYTMEVNVSETVAEHNFDKSVIITEETDAMRWQDDTRKTLPDSNGVIGNSIIRGKGQFVLSGEIYDFDNAAGKYSLINDEETGNKAFEINKIKEGSFITYATSGSAEPEAPNKLTASYKIKLLAADENKDLAQLYTSDLCKAVLTTKNQTAGKYTLGVMDKGAETAIIPENAPEMTLGKWYEIKYIYRKDITNSENGYVYELYVDNKFVCELSGNNGITGKLTDSEEYPQFALNGCVDAAFDMLFDDYEVTVVRPRSDIYVEKLPEGKNAAYTFTGDDGFKASAQWYNEILKSNGLKGSLALTTNKINTTNFGSYPFFRNLFADGVLSASNHSATHPHLTQDGINLESQINGAQTELRQNLPGQKLLTMCLPFNETNASVTDKIKENHYAMRYTGGSSTLHPSMEQMYTTAFYSLSSNTSAETMNGWIDDGVAKGRWIVEMWHEVIGDDVGEEGRTNGGGVDSALAKQHFEYIASHSDEIYSGTFDDMVCYILERQWVRFNKVQSESTDNEHKYSMWYYPEQMLKNEEDAKYFDVPVTMNVTVPSGWNRVVVSQNGEEYFADIYTEQTPVIGAVPRKYVLVNAVPEKGEITVPNVTVKNVSDDYVIKSNEKEISAASITVGGYTYNGLVNSADSEITFAIPYSTVKTETFDAAAGTKSPGIIPDMTKAVFNVAAVGDVTANGETLSADKEVNADNINSFEVTAENGTVKSYKVKYDYMAVSRRYNVNGASTRPTTEAEASKRGAPSYLGNGNAYNGNCGDGLWRISGMAYDEEGKVDEENTYARLTIESHENNASDNYIRLNKYKAGENVQLFSQTDYGNNSDVIKTQMRFNIASFENNNDGLIYMYTSDLDQILLSCKNTSEGKFTIAHRATSSDAIIPLDKCPELNTNTWYTLTTVFRKGAEYEKGYIIEIYIDNNYIASIANKDTVPSGTVHRQMNNYASGKNEFTLNSWRNAIYDIYIDDYEVMTVDNDGKADMTTVYLLGDSICRYYGSENSPQQGWGKYFDDVFNENTKVLNYSVGGYNTNIYLQGANRSNLKSAPIWPSIKKQIKAGDYVIIALGRNEANQYDGTKTTAAFKANLKAFADDCEALGVTPIFITSTPELKQTENASGEVIYGDVTNQLTFNGIGNKVYPAKDMREFASVNGYICLDLNAESYHALKQMPLSQCHDMFTGSTSKATTNSYNKDNLHITEDGAQLMSELLVKLLSESECSLKDRLATPYNESHAYVNSAQAVINGKTYTADVNTQRNTVSFEITETNADLSDVTVTVNTNGTAEIADTLNLTSAKTFTVTSPDRADTQTYTIQVDCAAYARTYDCNGASNNPTTHATPARRGAPSYLSTSKGGGAWFVENYVFNDDGTPNEEATYGSVNVQTDKDNPENKVIKFNKTKTGKSLSFSSNGSDSNALKSSSKISTEFKIRVNSLSGAGTLYINSSNLDHILITNTGAPERKYFIGYRPNADDNSVFTYTQKPLNFDEWHTVKYVFRKNTALEAGYTMEIYLDGEFLTETDCKNRTGTGAEYTQPTGSLYNFPNTFTTYNSQIAVRSFSGALADIDFDDFVITYVSDYEG